MASPTIPLAALLLLAGVVATEAAALDIRACPLDTVVFVDPWAGGRFAVSRVGTDYFHICDEGEEFPHESCVGPYGDLVLEGQYFNSEGDETGDPMFATYSVIKGSPCCDWTVATPGESTFGANFGWLAPQEVPLLGEHPFLSIDSFQGDDFGNPLMAAACTTRD